MDVIIIGAGGHGKVVLDILRAEGKVKPIGFIDADVSLIGTSVGGIPVLGSANLLPKLLKQKVRSAIIGIGDNRARLQYADVLRKEKFDLLNAIHPTACVSSAATLGSNVVIAAHATVCTEARLGDSVIVNTGAIIDHECNIEQGAHIGPGVCLAGRVRVGAGAFVGLGANVIQCLCIGEYAMVGAGATVIRDVPDRSTVVGVPARLIKTAPNPVVA